MQRALLSGGRVGLDSKARAALHAYRYDTDTASLLYEPLKRWWYLPFLRLLPTWIPANVLTLTGFFLSLLAFCALATFHGDASLNGALALAALGLWGYNTLDNVDGAQARRTGTSGPLGELLDHGADAFTIFLIPLGVALAFDMEPRFALLFTALPALSFWASVWAQYHTGKLPTSWLSDVEAALITALFLLFASFAGKEWVVSGPLLAMMVAAFPGFGWQVWSCLARKPLGRAHLQLVPVLIPQLLIFAGFALGDGAATVPAAAILMGTCAARASIGVIVARLYGRRMSSFDPLSLLAATTSLLAPFAAPAHQAEIAWAGAALLGSITIMRVRHEAIAIAGELGTGVFDVPELR